MYCSYVTASSALKKKEREEEVKLIGARDSKGVFKKL